MTDLTRRLWMQAQRYMAQGQADAARMAVESLLQNDPTHAPSHILLGNIAFAEGEIREASACALNAAEHIPQDADLIVEIAALLQRLGETAAARDCLDHPLLSDSKDARILMNMAVLRKMLGEHPQALMLFDSAKAAGMNTLDGRFQRALELIFNGRQADAESELKFCLDRIPTFGRAALAISRLRKQTGESNHIEDIRRRLKKVQPGTEDHASFQFALYKELEDIGQYDEAWKALECGNSILFAQRRYDSAFEAKLMGKLISCCTSELLDQEHGPNTGPQPIFIIGMPRSGTTLLDRMVGNHSQVTSAGELDDFGLQLRWITDHRTTLDETILDRLPSLDFRELGRRYLAQTQWRAGDSRYFVDKLPRNWMLAGLIRRALPQARILNLVRDPMDVCFSNYRALLGAQFQWSYNLESLASHYLQYRRVMAHWHAILPSQILDVSYTALTNEPEAQVRKVLAFCGLPWEPACIDVASNKTAVATLSMSQVREGIQKRFFEEWRHYEPQLQGLRTAIGA